VPRPAPQPHIHIAGNRCPYCDQPIPNDKAEEIRARMEAEERQRTDALTARLTQQFAQEKAQMEAAAREDEKKKAEAAAQQKIAALEQAQKTLQETTRETLAEANRQMNAAVSQYETLKASHDDEVAKRVQEVREVMEKDKGDAVNAEKARNFEEKQKLTGKLEDLTRQLEKKTADDLGEGAEIDLFELLRGEFQSDRIKRVGKGAQGADIIHEVVHKGKVCGRIVYDCKNGVKSCPRAGCGRSTSPGSAAPGAMIM
jgi:hypothetical protein